MISVVLKAHLLITFNYSRRFSALIVYSTRLKGEIDCLSRLHFSIKALSNVARMHFNENVIIGVLNDVYTAGSLSDLG